MFLRALSRYSPIKDPGVEFVLGSLFLTPSFALLGCPVLEDP